MAESPRSLVRSGLWRKPLLRDGLAVLIVTAWDVYAVLESVHYELTYSGGVGPGLYPFLVSLATCLAAWIGLATSLGRAKKGIPQDQMDRSREEAERGGQRARGERMWAMPAILAICIVGGVLVDTVGLVAMAGVVIFLIPAVIERQPLLRSAAIAALSTTALWLVFIVIFAVPGLQAW